MVGKRVPTGEERKTGIMKMKKNKIVALLLLAISAAVLVSGCKKEENTSESESVRTVVFDDGMFANTSENVALESEPEPVQTTIEGVRSLSFYRRNPDTKVREKKSEFSAPWVRGTDISSFEVFASDEESITFQTAYFDDAFNAYWNAFEGKENCRIGYTVDFDLKSGEHIHKTLLKAGDELEYRPYLENYLYDDVHQAKGAWYSHLLPEQMTDTTLMTSIKFTPGEKIDEVGDTITVKAFVYNSEKDFDENGDYIGDVFSDLIINRAN